MLEHVAEKVFPFIKILRGEGSYFTKQMKDATFKIPNGSLLQEAVHDIEDMQISHKNLDIQGDLYEHLPLQLTTAGKNGQFRTPRHIIRMMVELIDPKIYQKICDPACGTAGFLVAAYQHILKQYTSPDIIKYDEDHILYNLVGDTLTDKDWIRLMLCYENDKKLMIC
jgi:type I restriction enzyme M protein